MNIIMESCKFVFYKFTKFSEMSETEEMINCSMIILFASLQATRRSDGTASPDEEVWEHSVLAKIRCGQI